MREKDEVDLGLSIKQSETPAVRSQVFVSVPTGYVSGWVRAYHLKLNIGNILSFVNLFTRFFCPAFAYE